MLIPNIYDGPRRVSDVTGRVDNTPDLEYPDTVLAQYVTKYLTKSRTTDPGVKQMANQSDEKSRNWLTQDNSRRPDGTSSCTH